MWGGISFVCLGIFVTYTVKKMKCSGETEIPHELVHDLTQISSWLYDFRVVSFVRSFFASGIGFPLYPEIFYIITQRSRTASRSLWEMPDANPGPLPQKFGAFPVNELIRVVSRFPATFHLFSNSVGIVWCASDKGTQKICHMVTACFTVR